MIWGYPPILGNLQMQIITEMRPEMFPIVFRLTGFMAFGADGKFPGFCSEDMATGKWPLKF